MTWKEAGGEALGQMGKINVAGNIDGSRIVQVTQ